ncbi:MAG: hypothetical protein IIC21_03660 [Chloroflexi bacterium]|nr:hypothetical protein [Chloroflexota bacterium]
MLEGKLPEGVPDLVGGGNPLKALFGDKSSDDAAARTKTQDKGGEARNEIQKALGGLFGKKKKKDKGGG